MSRTSNRGISQTFPAITGFGGRNELVWRNPVIVTGPLRCKLVLSPALYDRIEEDLRDLDKTTPGNPKDKSLEQSAISSILEQLTRTENGSIFFWSEGTGGYVDVDQITGIVPGSNTRGDYYIQLIAEGIPTQVRILDICPWSSEAGTVEEEVFEAI